MADKLRIDLRQGRPAIEHGGVDAEPVEGLRQFEPLAAGAQNDEVRRLAAEIEHARHRQTVDAVEAGDFGRRRPGPDRQDGAAGADHDLAGLDGVAVGEAGGGVDHADALGGQPFGRDIGGNRRADGGHMLAHLGQIDLQRRPGDAHGGAAAQQFVNLRGGDQRLGGDGPGCEVGAPRRLLFDQDDGHALAGGRQRRGDARRAAANDAYVGGQGLRHPWSSCPRDSCSRNGGNDSRFPVKATARERPPRPEVVRVDSIRPAPYKPGAAGPRGDDTI